MNDEEIKAIEKLKWYFKDSKSLDIAKQTYIVLNLIEKQKHIIEGKECVIETQVHNEEVLNKIIDEKQAEIELQKLLEDERRKQLEKKDKIINNSIIEIEKLRQYFSEDLQVEFIRILEILKDKKVIDW